ncbi:unnamed protein product [Spirodela intermedia]|uniref:Uncharacterized protein n=1 Tax=Spirodela intermedia TaxID=51605 RepID=A0A7I8K3E7_SPIIN|nr:unnamed protein product [Spirodela intermedia]
MAGNTSTPMIFVLITQLIGCLSDIPGVAQRRFHNSEQR